MKQRILNIIAVLFLMVGTATAQSLSVADLEVKPKRAATIELSISGATEMTALQFNVSLPSGVRIDTDQIPVYTSYSGHAMNVLPLESGDYLFVFYSLNPKVFHDGVFVTISVVAGEECGTTTGSLYNVRMSTADATNAKMYRSK